MKYKHVLSLLLIFTILSSTQQIIPGLTVASIKAANPPAEDVVLQWNRVLTETLAIPGQQPPTIVAARSYALMHAAIFDAVNSIDGSYKPYLTDVPGSKNASVETAAARAAHDVLTALYPQRQSIFDAELLSRSRA